MKRALLVAVVATGCGGIRYDYEARIALGVEPQEVSATAFGAATPTLLSLRGPDAAIGYPLALSGQTITVESSFSAAGFPPSYIHDSYLPEAALPADALGVRLFPNGATRENPPPVDEYTGNFGVVVSGSDGEATEVRVLVRPEIDVCMNDGFEVPATLEIAPVATVTGFPTCLDGTSCAAFGTRVDPDTRTIIIAPFRITVRVQLSCQVSVG
jgi:hypothetical protein